MEGRRREGKKRLLKTENRRRRRAERDERGERKGKAADNDDGFR